MNVYTVAVRSCGAASRRYVDPSWSVVRKGVSVAAGRPSSSTDTQASVVPSAVRASRLGASGAGVIVAAAAASSAASAAGRAWARDAGPRTARAMDAGQSMIDFGLDRLYVSEK